MAKPVTSSRRAIAIVGFLLVALGSVALFWNEWRSARAVEALLAAERALVPASLDRVPIEPAGALVHLAGPARPTGPVADPLFPVGALVLRLDRIVEMQQWRETCEGSGNERQCRHDRVWAEGRIASERFRERLGHENPPAPPFDSERFFPREAGLGAYALGAELLALLPAAEAALPAPGAELIAAGRTLRADGGAFLSGDRDNPAIGDLRVRFRTVPLGEVSVIAGLDGSVLVPWTAPGGQEVALIRSGILSADELLAGAYERNALTTWGLRLAGVIAVFVGTVLALIRLVGIVPLLADLKAQNGKTVALLLALAWSLLVIAAAWLVFRPLVSLMALVLAVSAFAALRAFRARRLAESLAAEQARED